MAAIASQELEAVPNFAMASASLLGQKFDLRYPRAYSVSHRAIPL